MGITDKNGKWIAGKATLVQTGDLVDRGPNSIGVVRLFEDLKVRRELFRTPRLSGVS